MSIFKLDRHSKAQNVASSMANVSVWDWIPIYSIFEKSPKLQNGSHWKFLTFRDRLILTKNSERSAKIT